MHKTKILFLVIAIVSIAACSTNTKHNNDVSSTCVIKMDTPEGNLPGKIEKASGDSSECKAIEKAIDKSI